MTTWTFAGSALTSFGRVTLMDDYIDTASRRGSNVMIPYQDGATFVQKYYEERKITLGLAINAASAAVLESTLDSLKKLCAVRTQQTLSQTMEDTTIRTTSATVDNPFRIERKKDALAIAELEFTLTQPYFRSNTQTNGTITMSAGTVAGTIVNTGTLDERNPTITLIGPLNSPVITNSTNSYTLSYSGTIPAGAGGTVTIQTTSGQYVAANDLSANKIGNVTHTGGAPLMLLNAGGATGGTNIFSITNSGGTTGKVIVSFYPPYL